MALLNRKESASCLTTRLLDFVRAEQGNAVAALEDLLGPLGSGRNGRRGLTSLEEVFTRGGRRAFEDDWSPPGKS